MYMNNKAVIPEDANIPDGNVSWPHVLYHDVYANTNNEAA